MAAVLRSEVAERARLALAIGGPAASVEVWIAGGGRSARPRLWAQGPIGVLVSVDEGRGLVRVRVSAAAVLRAMEGRTWADVYVRRRPAR